MIRNDCGITAGLRSIPAAGVRRSSSGSNGHLHRIRAYAALISFINSLTVSLFALIPGQQIGTTSVVVACLGLVFVLGALLSLVRLRHVRWPTVRDATFLAGLAVVFGYELDAGIRVMDQPGDFSSVETIATMVVIC